jgi:GxxExxY protein
MAEADLVHSDITRAVIGAFFRVHKELGFGFLEARYAKALESELRSAGRHVARDYATRVYYKGEEIGFQRLDMVVDLAVVVELKAGPILPPFARKQLRNYLRATNLEVGLLLHFGPQARYERLYVPNDTNRKPVGRLRIPPPWEADFIDEVIEMEKRIEEELKSEGWKQDEDLDGFDDADDPDSDAGPPQPARM